MKNIILDTPVARNFFPGKVKGKHYKFGALSKEILMPDGHGWKKYRPDGETQSRKIDPNSCPIGGTLNCIEAIGNFKYNKGLKGYKMFQDNLSERYGSIMMGMTGYGGWPWLAAEMIRSGAGCIPEAFLPFNDKIETLKQYFSPRPMKYELFKIGYRWSQIYDFGFEWVFEPGDALTIQEKNARMKEALKYSPLGVAGYAWSLHSDGKYYNDGPAIHWFVIDEYIEGEYWDAHDTYPPYGKKLDWKYGPQYCMRYSLTKRIGAEDIEFDPENVPDCKLEYYKYLVKWFFTSFFKKI